MSAREPAPETTAPTIRAVLWRLAQSLDEAGVAEPRAEARRVLVAAGLAAEDIITRSDEALNPVILDRGLAIARRRSAREPLSRIAGERDFFGRAFRVSPATLDPRPDTETLIEATLDVVRAEDWTERPLRLLDIGTGSGCLLVTLLAELPRATGLGTDISAEALAVAARNAARHGVETRARFAVHRSLTGLHEPFDVLVANPPYIRTREIEALAPEVRDHDPRAALDGGPDGLAVYREIAGELASVVPDGWALFEVGAGWAGAVETILRGAAPPDAAWTARSWTDLGGHRRCVAVRTRI